MNEVLKSVDEYRGFFISRFSELERSIDVFIATYIVPDDEAWAYELIEVLIDRITFENKRTALKVILEKKAITDQITTGKCVPKGVQKKLLEEIRKLSIIRNYFAHYKTVHFEEIWGDEDLETDFKKSAISLIQLRDNTKHISYTNESFYLEIAKIERCRKELDSMLKE